MIVILDLAYNLKLGYNTELVFLKKNNEADDDDDDGTIHVVIAAIAKNYDNTSSSDNKSIELVSDQLLVAVGRVPNSDTLDLVDNGSLYHLYLSRFFP